MSLSPSIPLPRRARHWELLLAFFNSKWFARVDAAHTLANALKDPVYQDMHAKGGWPDPAFLDQQRDAVQEGLSKARADFCRCGAAMLVLLTLAVTINWSFGHSIPSWTRDGGKLMSAIGGALAAWGTLFQLGTVSSWKEDTTVELLRMDLFRASFALGAVLAFAGALW